LKATELRKERTARENRDRLKPQRARQNPKRERCLTLTANHDVSPAFESEVIAMNWIQLAGNTTGMFSYASAGAHAVFDAANTAKFR